MKRFTSVPATLLIFILFFQLNHIGLMSFSNPHGATSSCAEAKKTRATEKCLCCLIEQADKSSLINVAPLITPIRNNVIQNTDFVYTAPEAPNYNPSQNIFQTNSWINTVVQRK